MFIVSFFNFNFCVDLDLFQNEKDTIYVNHWENIEWIEFFLFIFIPLVPHTLGYHSRK